MATPPAERSPRGRAPGTRDYQTEFRNRLIQSRLTPNAISLTGFVLCLVSAGLILKGWWIAGGFAYIIGSVCDTLDGRYSRMSGKGTSFGAFLDSTLDRIEEGVVLAAVAVLASLMVSYTRARAEALGVECKVGIATRPVRVVILSIGLVFAKGAGVFDIELLAPAIYAMAALTAFTVVQRVLHVRNALKSVESEAAQPGV